MLSLSLSADLTRARVPERGLRVPAPELLEVEAVMGREVMSHAQHCGPGELGKLRVKESQVCLNRQVWRNIKFKVMIPLYSDAHQYP